VKPIAHQKEVSKAATRNVAVRMEWLASWLARMTARTAAPNEPPTCWTILIIVLASGTSRCGTP
jgi:hypothetical protein